jgi:hypothetical protein
MSRFISRHIETDAFHPYGGVVQGAENALKILGKTSAEPSQLDGQGSRRKGGFSHDY